MREYAGTTADEQGATSNQAVEATMDRVLRDMRYAVRQLLAQGGSSAVAIVTLALGIGVSTAIFSVVDATILRPLPYPRPEQLVEIYLKGPTPSMEDMRFFQKADDVFSMVAGWGSEFRGRIVEGAHPERLRVAYYTEDYLPMHGVTPIVGRNFTRDDTDPGSPLVTLISYGYWKSHYGGRADILTQAIRFDTETAAIVGVTPAWFDAETPIVTPMRIPLALYSRRGTGRVSVYARLRPDVTSAQATERISARMPVQTTPNVAQGGKPSVHISSRLDDALSEYRTSSH